MLRLALLAFVLVQTWYFVMAWLVPQGVVVGGIHMSMTPKWLTADAVAALGTGPLLAAMAVSAPVVLLTAYAAWRLDALLRALKEGALFAVATIGHLRAFAGAALGAMVYSVLETLVRGLIWRHAFGVEGRVDIGVSSEELLAILVCLLFFLIAGLMHEGRRLAEENEGFI